MDARVFLMLAQADEFRTKWKLKLQSGLKSFWWVERVFRNYLCWRLTNNSLPQLRIHFTNIYIHRRTSDSISTISWIPRKLREEKKFLFFFSPFPLFRFICPFISYAQQCVENRIRSIKMKSISIYWNSVGSGIIIYSYVIFFVHFILNSLWTRVEYTKKSNQKKLNTHTHIGQSWIDMLPYGHEVCWIYRAVSVELFIFIAWHKSRFNENNIHHRMAWGNTKTNRSCVCSYVYTQCVHLTLYTVTLYIESLDICISAFIICKFRILNLDPPIFFFFLFLFVFLF